MTADHDVKELVKQANDIVDVIGGYLALSKRGKTYKGLCPFHDDHRPSLDVDPIEQRYTCWACGKRGDVFTFIQEHEKLTFREALELLARRANIELKPGDRQAAQNRTRLLDLMKWAEGQYRLELLEAAGTAARRYLLEERRLSMETLERYGLGYAPAEWDWLARRAGAKWDADLLVTVGLCGRRADHSLYDRFRDRIMFPIRDGRGQTVGFGGRILPGSAKAQDGPKYYNSADTPLFAKSRNLYGIDRARPAGEKAGYLAVVEGYTDVLMAHQLGVLPVVATLGTALNEEHIRHLRKFVNRVVLVYDADAGGQGGVNRALGLFVSQEVDLAIASLPAGLDPCDFLLQHGPEAFAKLLTQAEDALEFKLREVLAKYPQTSTEGQRLAVEEVLQVLALAPDTPRQDLAVKQELMLTRLARRFAVQVQTLARRLEEIRRERQARLERQAQPPSGGTEPPAPVVQTPGGLERQVVQLMLRAPEWAARMREVLQPEDVGHPGIRRVLHEVFTLAAAGTPITLEGVLARLADVPRVAAAVSALYQEAPPNRNVSAWAEDLIAEFTRRRQAVEARRLREQLKSVPPGTAVPSDLLRRLQTARSEP